MTGTRVARSRQLAVTALTSVFLAGACADGGSGSDTGPVATAVKGMDEDATARVAAPVFPRSEGIS